MSPRNRGVILVLISALTFALATTISKLAVQAGAAVPQVTWLRFASGFVVALILVARDPSKLRAESPAWVAIRAVSNTFVVFLLFYSVQYTTVTKANMLNLTYPVFVFLFAPFVVKERITRVQVVSLVATIVGVFLVAQPFGAGISPGFQLGDGLALLSALTAGFAITALRRARATDHTVTIMFYLMSAGLFVNTVMLFGTTFPGMEPLLIAGAAGACGAIGQFAFTGALKAITAASGAVISTTRILFATFLGVAIFSDQLDYMIVIGAVLIAGSIVLVSAAPHGVPAPVVVEKK